MSDNNMRGRAKKYDGTAIDYVSIFNWTDGKCITQVKPDAAGAWSYRYTEDERVGITYVADGCEPITHGAYDFIYMPILKKYWRIINVIAPQYGGITATELRFLNKQGVGSNNPSKISHLNQYESFSAANLVDGQPSTFSHSKDFNAAQDQYLYWIMYEFDTPVEVDAIRLSMRSDTPLQWWISADIEYSDDGIEWTKLGSIYPKFAELSTPNIERVPINYD